MDSSLFLQNEKRRPICRHSDKRNTHNRPFDPSHLDMRAVVHNITFYLIKFFRPRGRQA